MRRVVLVIHAIVAGGAERVMTTMANHWAAEGREVFLVTLDDGTQAPFYELHPAIERRPLSVAGRSRHRVDSLANTVKRVRTLRKAIVAARPDVVISFMTPMNLLVLLATTGLGIPVIVSERVDPRAHRVNRVTRALRRILYRRAECVVCQSEAAREYFPRHFRTVVIPNPVVPIGESGSQVSTEGQRQRTVMAMGRLEMQKGFDLLIEAFAKLAPRHPEWDLRIFGEGSCRSALEAQVASLGLHERIFLPGLSREPGAELERAGLFVLPSRYEGFPNVLCEAMARGLPVIAFDCPTGPRDIVRDGHDGLLVPPGDVTALERAVERLIMDEMQRGRIARKAPEVAERFSLNAIMARWQSVIERGVQPGKTGDGCSCDLSATMKGTGGTASMNIEVDPDPPGRGSPVRVLFVIRALACGGAERQLTELVKAMDKQRFDITVATFYGGGSLEAEIRSIPGVRLVCLEKRGRWDMGGFLSRFVRLLRDVQPDVTHGYMGFCNELTLLGRWLTGCRAIWGLRGSGCDYRAYDDWARGFGDRFAAWLSRFADRIVVNSECGRQDHLAEGYAGGRMVVIHNGIDTERFRPEPEEGHALRREWGLPLDAPVIGLVARLDPMKDHPLFLQAAAMLACRRADVRFVCVGDGNEAYRTRLWAMAAEFRLEDRLQWWPARHDVGAVYNALTILTSCSRFGEGFSNAIAEAMACGTPVVATDVGDARKIVNDPAWIIPPGKPERLVETWETLLDLSGPEKERRALKGREWIVREFGTERLVDHTQKIILESLSCRR